MANTTKSDGSKDALRRSSSQMLPPQIRFTCTHNGCEKTYGSKTSLQNHLRSQHGLKKRGVFGVCDKHNKKNAKGVYEGLPLGSDGKCKICRKLEKR